MKNSFEPPLSCHSVNKKIGREVLEKSISYFFSFFKLVLTSTYTKQLFEVVVIVSAENLGCKVIGLRISEEKTQTAASQILASNYIVQILVRLVNKEVID